MSHDLPAALDVIAVGAHPDDVEIGCGGTLAVLASQGHRVGIIDLTDGEPTPKSPGPHVRFDEAQAAARCLGAVERVWLDLPNRRLFDSFEARVALAREFRRFRPRLVLGLGGKTPLASPDHWQAAQIIDAAVLYSSAPEWDEPLGDLPPHQISRKMDYTLIFGASGPWSSSADLYVDIRETLETKLAAVRCYQTQFPPEKEYVFERLRAMALERGMAAGCAAAERLICPRPPLAANLGPALLG